MTEPLEPLFRKRTLAPGWCEITIVMQRPQTPDYEYRGALARNRLAHFMLSTASGICDAWGMDGMSKGLRDLWERISSIPGIL